MEKLDLQSGEGVDEVGAIFVVGGISDSGQIGGQFNGNCVCFLNS